MKLKKILKESNAPGYKDRKFGTPLPTLDSVQKAYEAKQSSKLTDMAEDLKVDKRDRPTQGSSLAYILSPKQQKNMEKILKKNSNNPLVKSLMGTMQDKYSDDITIVLDNRPFHLYASYGRLRIGAGGKSASQWNDDMKDALAKYLGEGKLGVISEGLRSNIAQKWADQKTIEKDLLQFIDMAMDAGGDDLVDDIQASLAYAAEYAMKKLRGR